MITQRKMTRFNLFTLLLVLSSIMTGCNEYEQHKTIGEKELYFDEQLASISTDGDSGCWIGSGTGDIWYIGDHIQRSYNIGTDRIYKVAADRREPGLVTYWLGIRNSGLQKRIVTEGHPALLSKYNIPVKGDSYSVYDILVTDNMVYAATSQGVYGLRNGTDTLTLLYPGKDSETFRSGRPFMTHNICKCGDACVVVSSQYGLIRIDLATNQVTVMHEGERVYNVSVADGKLYALTDNKMYIDGADGTTLKEVQLGFTAQVHHKVGKTHYFIDGGHVVLSENQKDFVPVTMRRKVPQYCGNVITTDGRKGFTLMLTDNALWRIPHHTGLFNVTGEILAACTDGHNNIYYVNSANEIYRQDHNDTIATKIYNLPGGETVGKLMSAGGNLFYISNQRKVVRLDIQNTFLQNEVMATAKTIYDAPTKITASYAKETEKGYVIYVGIHDELVCINDDDRVNTVRCMSGKYITSFYSAPNSGTIYISTLNKGVFYGCDNKFKLVSNTQNNHFIRDIAVTGEHIPLMMMLTNHHLILNESNDTTELKGFNKLLYVNDSLFYAMPEYGIQRYVINDGQAICVKEDFTDIRFNPNASFVLDGKVYLGSDIGVLKIDPYDTGTMRWIVFDSDVPDIRTALVAGSFVLMLLLIMAVAYHRRKIAHRKMIRTQIDDLHKRLDGMNPITKFDGSDDKTNIEKLKEELEQLCVSDKNISDQIAAMSEKIMRFNRNVGIQLSKRLNKQIEQIAHFDAYEMPTLIEESRKAEATDNTEHILRQVVKNEKWIKLFTAETERMAEYRSNINGTIMIEGVTDILASQLDELTENLHYKKMAELADDIKRLDSQYRYLFSRDAMKKVEQYIMARKAKIAPMAETDEVAEALVAHINRQIADMHTKDRLELLRELQITDCRICQVLIRKEIAGRIHEYTELREEVINENEKRVVKKFETKLEIEIADHTSFITEHIEHLIADFYRYMEKTDKEIMNSVLKFPSLSAQSPKVLVLLIADPKVKRVCLPGILGMFGNMNPVISRLINNRLKPGHDILKEYAEKYPMSMVCHILKLME